MNVGDHSTAVFVAIEPLTQADMIAANPILAFGTNVRTGILRKDSGVVIPTIGMATMGGNLYEHERSTY
ncbi:hypothetical protein [Niallia endozanthoxylica]|uniref:Uncharacterized protein n=1 Tax=Niallia endozanthoxylica TaxID=2036016 RepID=A0A5J5H9G5_9BACI|nr:hypothetical protein [Niallia endozanthoxylica]KAA9016937.1 hypothetical protein F4V44_20930 [Niallia endozanthoxylica]